MEESKIMFEIAELANKKGFKTHSVTTIFTNMYLLGGKKTLINDTCILLWMCELQKWLREVHDIDVFVNRDVTFNKGTYCIFIYDNIKNIARLRPLDNNTFSGYTTYEEALEIGLQEALKLIPNK